MVTTFITCIFGIFCIYVTVYNFRKAVSIHACKCGMWNVNGVNFSAFPYFDFNGFCVHFDHDCKMGCNWSVHTADIPEWAQNLNVSATIPPKMCWALNASVW